MHTRLLGSVQLGSNNTAGHVGAGSGDLEVDALGVELGTADIIGTVKGENLVSENIVAGGDARRNSDDPLEVVLEQDIRSPLEKSEQSF